MTTRVAMLALICVGASGPAMVQAQTPPEETTPPSTSSQPAPKEAPATGRSTSRPSSASSPHQRQATGKEMDQMMKDCIAKERAADSSVSESAAEKTCKEHMKSSSPPSNR